MGYNQTNFLYLRTLSLSTSGRKKITKLIAMKSIVKLENVESMHLETTDGKKKTEKGADIANQLVDDYVEGSITTAQEIECLRRIDMWFMPIMFISTALQYMDKAALTAAALFGILEDLDLLKL